MKKLNILLISLVCILGVSCDDFLDIKPVGKIIPTTQADFRGVLTNAYLLSPFDRRYTSVRGDELSLKKDAYGDYLYYLNQYTWQDESLTGSDVSFAWQAYYSSILGANQVILDGVDATEVDKDSFNQLQGEAYLLRAYMHFCLVNNYADVYSAENLDKKAIPLSIQIDIWHDYRRNTINEVYTQILSDIDEGIKLLSVDEQSKGLNYRFSKISAYGLASRVHLYMSDWDNAVKYAKMALSINSSLTNYNDADVIMPFQFDSRENILAMEKIMHRTFNKRFYISSKLENQYDKDNDLRFVNYFDGSTAGEYKLKIGSDLKYKVSMRTAEFYLTVAEGQSKSSAGDLVEAKKYLKDLLVTRLKPALYTTEAAVIDAMTKEQFIVKVSEERMKELAGQGFRWFDLRRNGKPEIKKTFDGKDYTLSNNDPRYIIPFPIQAVSNNPNLKE